MTQIDKETFDNIKERMKQKFPVLVDVFLKDARSYIAEICANVSGDINAVIHAAHSLKSASGILGLTQMQTLSEHIEDSGRDIQDGADTEEARAAIKVLSDELQSAFQDIEGTLQQEIA